MNKRFLNIAALLVITSLLLSGCQLPFANLLAQTTTAPQPTQAATPAPTEPAPTPVSSAGPVLITGSFEYSNDIVTDYYVEHAVALLDMTGFVTRDREWELPIESQVLGYLEFDIENHTGTFRLQLPALPAGVLNDVNPDGSPEGGVQIFSVGYSPNLTGGPFSEGDDKSYGWPSYLASVVTDSENQDEVIGGKLVIWSPDEAQQFPTGFGADGLLFTADDPVGPIPAGYSVIDLDQEPFGILRNAEEQFTLYEPADIAIKDFGSLSYSEAFDQMFEIVRKEYAFNDVPGKAPNWDDLYTRVAPMVQAAEDANDATAYFLALREFVFAFKDGHVGLDGGDYFYRVFMQEAGGGVGLAARELDDGSVLVVYVLENSPAALAGIQVGDVINAVDGTPVSQAIEAVTPLFGPYSTDWSYRYDQVLFLLRGPVGRIISLTYTKPDGEEQTASLTAIQEFDSIYATWVYGGSDDVGLPVTYEILPSGVGYIRLTSNYDDLNLIIRLFQRALQKFTDYGVTGVIIDMRNNSGGANLGLAGFLYDQEIPLGQLEYYSDATGQFEPEGVREKVLPNMEQYSFDKMALLVGQACFSACEIEAYGFSQVPGMMVIGQYPTGGVEAEVARGQFTLPEGFTIQVPTGRFILPDGSIFLEGVGVQPTVRVPITAENLLSGIDMVLDVAVSELSK